MNREERQAIRDEFIESVVETNRELLKVLAQNPVRGGILGKTRLLAKAKENKNGTMPSNET